MVDQASIIMIPDEVIFSKIFLIRNKQVILDRDLAVFYQVETKQLKRSVRRNIDRFPNDFMFELTLEEFQYLRSQFGTSSWGGSRYTPMAFSEYGIVMLASVLHSQRAIKVNIQIVRAFLRMREILNSQNIILSRLENVETSQIQQGERISLIFKLLEEIEKKNKKRLEHQSRKKVGFKRENEQE
ncbi:MAG: ORF6N domain-containing protein [Bacteroidota bacterium]